MKANRWNNKETQQFFVNLLSQKSENEQFLCSYRRTQKIVP
jgi:hypothetical protein